MRNLVGEEFEFEGKNTTSKIMNNVMLDVHVTVDGKKVSEFRNKDDMSGVDQLTEGQVQKVISAIDEGKINGEAMYDN
ncbi:hypothetical protein K6119_17015 [Paracrocinitomix mangrovi]|uniref:hypothetical protein n=1 Tax=Paracrocinitomix mangrovi TaxID=2862509 RepID=UPI001C8E7C6F|nr:hypothetical protein [Paracrocinitomix mangrovi]UKN01428.1 hypothetical protein K6119_17015 [Paracrocinitomix mangrovi]